MGDAIGREESAVYTQLLRISPDKCPPNHFDLLGIARDEREATRIEAAARQRIEQLRRGASPELLRAARLVLKKIERARTCLLDYQARAAYDFALSGERGSESSGSLWDELDLEALEASSKPITIPGRSLPDLSSAEFGSAITGRSLASSDKQDLSQQRVIVYSLLGTAFALVSIIVAFAFWPDSKVMVQRPVSEGPEVVARKARDAQVVMQSEPSPAANIPLPETKSAGRESAVSPADDSTAFQQSRFAALTNFEGRNRSGTAKAEPDMAGVSDIASSAPRGRIKEPHANSKPPASDIPLKLLDATELPAQHITDSSLPATAKPENEAIELGSVPLRGLNLTIDPPTLMAVNGVSFDVTSDTNSAPGHAWEVRIRSKCQENDNDERSFLDDIAAGLDEVIARIYVQNGKLMFEWTESRYSQLSEQLRNCVLCLAYDNQVHRIQLRPCQKIAPVVLNLDQSVVTIPVADQTLPSTEATFIAVTPSPDLQKYVAMTPESGCVPCNKLVTLKVVGDEQLQIEIRVILRSNPNGLLLAIGPRYRLGSDWQPLTTNRLNKGLEGLKKAIVRHQHGLEQARQAASSISSQISSVQGRLGSANDPAERHKLQMQLVSLQRKLNTASNRIQVHERAIPETQQDLALMQKLVDTGNRLSGYFELGMRVGVKTVNGELDLLSTE